MRPTRSRLLILLRVCVLPFFFPHVSRRKLSKKNSSRFEEELQATRLELIEAHDRVVELTQRAGKTTAARIEEESEHTAAVNATASGTLGATATGLEARQTASCVLL